MCTRTLSQIVLLFLALTLPVGAFASWEPQELDRHTSVYWPDGEGKVPVIIMFQGTGDIGRREVQWARWFQQQGVGVAVVNSAALRGRRDFSGADSFFDYSSDAVDVANWLDSNPRLDNSRVGLIGFSRGGTMAMMAGSKFAGVPAKPSLIFSFYPGAESRCPNTHTEQVNVHIFYGDIDEWGIHQGLQKACKALSDRNKNVFYHEFVGAHHAFDRPGIGSFSAYRRTFATEFNADAVNSTQQIILNAMRDKWDVVPTEQQ